MSDLEEYTKFFPVALPYFHVCRALMEQQQNKKKVGKFLEEGLGQAEVHGMTYMTGIYCFVIS